MSSKDPKTLFLGETPVLRNTLKTEKVLTPILMSGTGVYNSFYECALGTKEDNLAQLVLEVDVMLSAHTDPLTVQEYVGTQICSRIEFGTKTLNIATLYPEIIGNYIDECYGSSLYSLLQRGVESSGFDAVLVAPTSFKFCIPLPFFFSQKGSRNFLNTKKLEELYLRFYTNESAQAMGITSISAFTINSFTFDIRKRNHSIPEDNAHNYIPDYPRSARPITNSYSVYREIPLVLDQGAKTATVLMTCPFPIYRTHYCVVSKFGNLKNVQSVSTDLDGDAYKDEYFLTNYSLYAHENKGYLTNQYFTEDLTELNDRAFYSGLLTYSPGDHMYPCYKTVSFEEIPAAPEVFSLIVYHEHYTSFSIDQNGKIRDSTVSSGVKNF